MQLHLEEKPDYLVARLTGAGAPGEVSQRFELIAEHCKRANEDKLLIDTTGFDVKVSTADRFLLGERLGIFARYKIKVAFVCTPEQVDPQKFGMLVARNRGVSVDTFTDYHAAVNWLLA